MKTPAITQPLGTHKFMRALVAGVALCTTASGLAACGSLTVAHDPPPVSAPSASAIVGGRYDRILTVGSLQISPSRTEMTTKNLGLTWDQAAKLFEATSEVQGSHAQAILGYGLVTLGNSKVPPPGTPPLDHRGAWVGIAWGGVTSCPAANPPKDSTSTKTAYRSIYTAVVIYGQGGDGAVVYTNRGTPPCGGPLTGPKLATAREVLSVPWQPTSASEDGSIPVAYRAPSCAGLFSTTADGNLKTDLFKVGVEVTVPFDYAKCQTITNTTDVVLAPHSTTPGTPTVPPHPILAHAPTGLVKVLEVGDLVDSGPHASPTSLSSLSID
ncbi:hypothetical protein [Ferrimicrobium sp.]|uniref:hypothetical protein n=1 Tax=Ferrimicrobium sp. TaxID=2926050 RepID=UPI00261C93ED|nr:hypothetical protein [Ferrimicrobium sp.]